MENIQVLINVQ